MQKGGAIYLGIVPVIFCRGVKQGKRLSEFLVKRTEFKTKTMHTSHYITILQYIGETGRRLGDRFREHLRDVELNDEDASKHFARHFNLPNQSKQHMAVCGLSLHLGSSESRKALVTTTHNSSNRSDEKLTLETSAF